MSGIYAFDRCEVRPAERQLLVGGAPAALGARAFDLLMALIERRERVVEKAELFDAVWPGLVVEENNLQVQVSSLRKLLGPNAIATVPGRGYQFVAALFDATPASAGPTPPAAPPPTNLPHARTRFIGREGALSDCATLLRDTRLLTLSGIGGCGKTRLAQELAQRELPKFPDGVWFVDLGPLQEAQRVAATVAATLGVQVGQLTDHLHARRALVVMDNCEHVIGAAAESVAMLLEKCGALKIIATSREVLGMAGEQVFAVRSLSLPTSSDPDEVRQSEAARLFVDHARLVVPDFDVDARNAGAIAEICRRLDGIALAIELAAARVRVLDVEDIRARLDDRFRLLTGGNRALPRHQTLHATMQWSHDHLTAAEQALFRRLAVFAGGCTLAAAAGVGGDDADEYDVLERLTGLHDKSLVLVDRDTQAQPRYRMLETVRQYAEERLTESGESDDVRTRHLLHFVAFAAGMASDAVGPRASAWYATVAREQENLGAAHAWCEHAPNGGTLGLRLFADTWRYWIFSAQPERGYRIACTALDGAGAAPESVERCRTLYALSTYAYRMGRYAETRQFAQQSLEMARRLGDPQLTADGLIKLAIGLQTTGDPDGALARYEQATTIARPLRDEQRLGHILNGRAEIHRARGELVEAEKLYRDSIRLSPHDNRNRAVALVNLASVMIVDGRLDEAQSALAEARSLARSLGYRILVECATDVTAALATTRGEHRTAARMHGAFLRQMHEAQIRQDPIDEAFVAPRVADARAALGDAAFDAARDEGWALEYDVAINELDRWLGVIPP